jgi:hypothetical protein
LCASSTFRHPIRDGLLISRNRVVELLDIGRYGAKARRLLPRNVTFNNNIGSRESRAG